jgi:hypothetical protein
MAVKLDNLSAFVSVAKAKGFREAAPRAGVCSSHAFHVSVVLFSALAFHQCEFGLCRQRLGGSSRDR